MQIRSGLKFFLGGVGLRLRKVLLLLDHDSCAGDFRLVIEVPDVSAPNGLVDNVLAHQPGDHLGLDLVGDQEVDGFVVAALGALHFYRRQGLVQHCRHVWHLLSSH